MHPAILKNYEHLNVPIATVTILISPIIVNNKTKIDMKKIFLILLVASLTIQSSCSAQQKIMRTVQDAPKLVEHKSMFVNQPLSLLLDQIRPEIVTVFGDPNKGITGTYLIFYFVDRQQYNEMIKKGEKPIGIRVGFYPETNPKRQPIPQGGITDWGSRDVKAYGDMKIASIRIVGGNK